MATVLPNSPFLAVQAIKEGSLRSVLDNYPMPENPVHLLYQSHRHPSRLVRVYLDFCQEYLQHWCPSLAKPSPVTHPQAESTTRERVGC